MGPRNFGGVVLMGTKNVRKRVHEHAWVYVPGGTVLTDYESFRMCTECGIIERTNDKVIK